MININTVPEYFIEIGEQEYANGVKGADFTVAVPRGTLVIDNRYDNTVDTAGFFNFDPIPLYIHIYVHIYTYKNTDTYP